MTTALKSWSLERSRGGAVRVSEDGLVVLLLVAMLGQFGNVFHQRLPQSSCVFFNLGLVDR